MERSIARWTTTVAAAALLSMPAISLAQAPEPSQPPSQPPTQPPTSQPEPTPTQPPGAAATVDAEAAKKHLTAARNALSAMTQMPEASQLTGDARTQVSELISNFNTLITTTTDWSSAYAKVEANLNTLIGPQGSVDEPARTSGTEGAVGTSGTAAITPGIRAKLVEVRNHLKQFEQAAGGASPESEPGSGGSAAATTAPATAGAPSSATSAAGTPASATPAEAPAAASSSISRDEAMQHIQAIETLLSGQPAASAAPGAAGTSGAAAAGAAGAPVTLDAATVQQLRSHLAELKRIIGDR